MDLSLELGGSIVSLEFDDWLNLEGPAAFDWEDYYGERQTFFFGPLDEERWSDELDMAQLVAVGDFTAFWHWLLLVVSYRQFLPHPRLSLCYILMGEFDSELRVGRFPGIGDLDCLRQPMSIEVKQEHGQLLAANGSTLQQIADNGSFPILHQVAESFTYALTRRQTADCWLDFTCQLEFLLNPEAAQPLKKQFSRRFATVCANNPEENERWVEIGRLLYRFRSELLHGEALAPDAELFSLLGSDYPFPAGIILRIAEFLAAIPQSVVNSKKGVGGCLDEGSAHLLDTFGTGRIKWIDDSRP